jgi:UDP-N-acetylglucosamine acyltransferase
MKIDPTAIIHPKAELHESVEVGPHVIIDEGVHIGARTVILANAVITGWTEIGEDNVIHYGAVIGHRPQHVLYKGAQTFTRIGNRNIIREYVTIHRAFEPGHATVIGDDNFLMALSHVAHDCKIGNQVVIVNGALLAGHVSVDDMTVISGNVAVHQFVRIGKLAMIRGLTGIGKDVPPYMIVSGVNQIRGLNVVGLKRAGFSAEARERVKQGYKILYRSGLNVNQALAKLESEHLGAEVQIIIDFVRSSKRGICRHATPEEMEKEEDVD